jgi:hypothetical protein
MDYANSRTHGTAHLLAAAYLGPFSLDRLVTWIVQPARSRVVIRVHDLDESVKPAYANRSDDGTQGSMSMALQ